MNFLVFGKDKYKADFDTKNKKFVAKGATGKVYKIYDRKQRLWAMKAIFAADLEQFTVRLLEVLPFLRLQSSHPNIVQYKTMYVWQNDDKSIRCKMIMEYFGESDLQTLITKKKNEVDTVKFQQFMQQIISANAFLASNGINLRI